jgi:TRAP-type C4-dicarboxylate transport system permease small subunit
MIARTNSRAGPAKGVLLWLEANLEEVLVIGLLIFLVCSVTVEVFRRYILNSSGEYSEEIARYALIWMVYLGVPYAIKQRRHIICDVLPSSLSRRASLAISLVSYALFFAFSLLMVYENYQLVVTQIAVDKRTEAMHIPIWYFSSGIGIGFALAATRLLQAMRYTLRAMRSGAGGDEWAWQTEAQKGFD